MEPRDRSSDLPWAPRSPGRVSNFPLGAVGGHRQRLRAGTLDLGDAVLERLRVPSGHDHLRAALPRCTRDRPPKAARGPGHDDDLVGKRLLAHVGSVSWWRGLETPGILGGMPNIGATEIVLLLLLALLLFGARRLPEIGRSLGRGMREFKDAVTTKDEDGREQDVPERELPPPPPAETTSAPPERERDSVH